MTQPGLPAQRFQNVINFQRVEMACQKVGSVICALFVVYWFSLEAVTMGKRGNILSASVARAAYQSCLKASRTQNYRRARKKTDGR